MRKFFRIARELGARSISVALLILGLLYVWPDIEGLPAAYGYPDWSAIVPARETVAFFLLFLALLWIIWMDIRPAVLRSQQAKGALRIDRFIVEEAIMEAPGSNNIGLRLKFFIHNHAKIPIYFKLSRALLSLNGRINQEAAIVSPVITLHPDCEQGVTMAGIKWLDKSSYYEGRDEVEIEYGSNPKSLSYRLEHEGVI